MSLTDEIKDFALDIGYHAVGITTAEPFPQLKSALEDRADDYASFRRLHLAIDPHNNLTGAKSIVVCMYDYFTEGFPKALSEKIARSVQSRAFLASSNRLHVARLHLMREFLERYGEVGPTHSSAIAERQAAVRAGLGQFGRNTLLSVPGKGSFVMIQSYVVDVELEYDRPLEGSHCPPNCHLCRDACPTGAIVADFRTVPMRCITYLASGGGPTYIPRDIRAQMGTSICGCDLCQVICPRNQPKLKAKLPVSPFLKKKDGEFDLVALLQLDDRYYSQVVQPLIGNFIRDQQFLRRNAAITLGNQGDLAAVSALAEALYDHEEVVRAHAAWALGRLGGTRARLALEAVLAREPGQKAKQEIEEALLTS